MRSVSTSRLPRTPPRENHLLAALPAADLERLLPYLIPAALPLGAVLYESGSPMRHCYFPVSGLVSVLQTLEDGHMAEIAVIGNDGCVGVPIRHRARPRQAGGAGLRVLRGRQEGGGSHSFHPPNP